MIGALLGLFAAFLIGLSDLFGRRITPLSSAVTTALTLQLFAAISVILGLLLWPGEFQGSALLLGASSGVGFAAGLCCYYLGLTRSSSALVAPIAAVLSVLIPFAWALARRFDVSALAVIGVLVAILGLTLVTRKPQAHESNRSGLKWGVFSGLGYGFGQAFLLDIESVAGPIAIASQRVIAYLVMVPVAFAAGSQTFPPRGTRVNGIWAGVFAGGASVALFQGLRYDPLAAVTAVAIFPIFTICVGRVFYGDSVTRGQAVGILFAILGTIAVIAG
ncbi:MAG: DMT family transporter [Acidimicrobiales bacterium]|jgi:drug/metabolite transporter (DMT)-like permease|nr:DMT family transporter [Acidimicrobiales bacterium]